MPQKPPAPRPASWFAVPGNAEGCWLAHDHERLTYWSCGHARRITHKRSPFLPCPPCAAERKQRRKYIAGHVALLLVQLVLMAWIMTGAAR